MGTLLPMSAHYATSKTLAHTLQENAPTTRLSLSSTTMRRVNKYTRPFETPQKVRGLHRSPDLILVTADDGSHPHTSQTSPETLYPTQSTVENYEEGTIHYPSTDGRVADTAPRTNMDCLEPLPATEATRIKRHTTVSQDPRYSLHGPSVACYDDECTSTPR